MNESEDETEVESDSHHHAAIDRIESLLEMMHRVKDSKLGNAAVMFHVREQLGLIYESLCNEQAEEVDRG